MLKHKGKVRPRVWYAIVMLLLSAPGLAQCPERPRDPDPPGWAIDYGGAHGISAATISPDGKWIAFEADGATWLTDTGLKQRKQLIPCIEVASTLAFSPDSSKLAQGDGNGAIRIFEVPDGRMVREIRGEGWHQQLYWGPSGLLASVRSYGLSIWDTVNGHQVSDVDTLACGDRGTCDLEFFDDVEISPDARLIATADRRTTFEITVRELSGRKIAVLKGPNKGHNFLFDPENPTVLIVAEDRDLVWWDARSGQMLKRVKREEPDTGVLTSPAGVRPAFLIVDAYQARVFSRDTGKLLDRWNSIGFNSITPDARWALTWDLHIWHLPSKTPVGQVTYTPSGNVVPPWSMRSEYLAARIRPKEPSLWLVLGILTLVAVSGFLLCRRSRWLAAFAVPAVLFVDTWWLRELYAPVRGPGIAATFGLTETVLSLVTVVAATALPLLGAFWSNAGQVTSRISLKWALPVL